jgi:hypothetical protein
LGVGKNPTPGRPYAKQIIWNAVPNKQGVALGRVAGSLAAPLKTMNVFRIGPYVNKRDALLSALKDFAHSEAI